MSRKETRIYFEKFEIEITTLTQAKITEIEEALVKCLVQKEEKLNIILKQLSVCEVSGHIFVQDKYGVADGLIEITEAFGMQIKQVKSSRKGKCYLISDSLVPILKTLQSDYCFGRVVVNGTADEEIKKIASENAFVFRDAVYSSLLSEGIKNLKDNNIFKVEGTAKFEQEVDVYQGKVIKIISTKKLEDIYGKQSAENELKQFMSDIKLQLKRNNLNMQNGTTELLYRRAKQMGYSVTKEMKGNQIQLVMVRAQ